MGAWREFLFGEARDAGAEMGRDAAMMVVVVVRRIRIAVLTELNDVDVKSSSIFDLMTC